MRRPIVAGNWKMHGSRHENARLIEDIVSGYPANAGADCVVCPPFVYLQEVGRLLRDTPIALGAQDTCADAHGAFTGEVSAGMLKDVGCKYVLVGHSERRLIYRESDQLVARKFAAAHAKSLIPVLCVGEQLADREASRTEEVIARQLDDTHVVIRADFDERDLMMRQFPGTFSVPSRYAKHMMVVADIRAGDAGAIEDALEAAWQLQRSAD